MNSFGLGVVLRFTDNFSLGVGTATTAFNGLSQAIDTQAYGITNTLTSLLGTATSIGTQLTTAITTPVTAIAGTFLSYGVARASFVENATLAFSTLMGDTKEASAYLQELMDFAKTTPFTYETITSVAQQFLAYGTDMGSVLKSLNDDGTKFSGILQALGDAAGGLGKGEAFIAEVSESLVRMKTDIESGTSITVRLQQLESRGLQVSRILGNMWNVQGASASVISEYVKENNISYTKFLDDLTTGIEKGTDGVNGTTAAMEGLMANIKNTWTGALDTWKSSLKTAGKDLMDYDEESGTYGFLTDMTKALNICSTAVKTFAPLLQPLVTDIRNAMSKGSAYLQQLIDKWEKVPQYTKDRIGKIVEVLTLLGPALVVVGKGGGAVASIFGSFGGTLSRSLRFTFSPIGLLTGLLAGLVGAFVHLWNTSDEFKTRIKNTFSGISEAWSKNAVPLRKSIGRVATAFIDLFEQVTKLLSPVFKGLFDSFGEAGGSSASVLVSVLNGLAKAINLVADGIGWLNDKWDSLPTDTQDKITNVVGKVALLALGLTALFKVFKSLKGVTTIFDHLPFIGGKQKKDNSGGSSGGFLSNPKKVAKTMGSIAIILGGTAILVTALGALMTVPFFGEFLVTGVKTISTLFSAIIPIVVTVGALSLLVAMIDKLNIKPSDALKGFLDIAILLGGLTILITAIGALESIPYFTEFLSTGVETMNKLYTIILPVTIMVGALSLLVAAFDLLNIDVKDAALGFANIAIILGGFTVLVTAIGALMSIPYFSDFVSTGTETLTAMFDNMKIFTTGEFWLLMLAVAALGLLSPGLVALGLAGLAEIIGGMTLIVTAFGALALIPGINDFMEGGGELLATVFEQVGKAVGSLIGGVGEAISQALPTIGTNLSKFAENLQPFFTLVSDAPIDNIGDFLLSISGFLIAMTASELLSFFTGELDLVALALQLNLFGVKSKGFFNAVAEYPEEGITKAKNVFIALQGMGSYDFKTGGLFQLFTGTTDMGAMGEQLAKFAPNAREFFTQVALSSDAGIEKAPLVFEALKGAGNYDFKTWGIAQLFTGSTDLTNMGEQLASFAPNMRTFFTQSALSSDVGIEKTPLIFNALKGVGSYDFKTWGLAQLFTGTTDLKTMGEHLASFAPNMRTFFDEFAELSGADITKGERVLSMLTNIGGYDFKTWGLSQLFTGSTDLNTIGEHLAKFAPNARAFLDEFEGLDTYLVTKGEMVLKMLALVGDYDFKTGGFLQSITGSVNLTDLGTQLSSFAQSSMTFFNNMALVTDESISRGSKVFELLGDIGSIPARSGGLLGLVTGDVSLSDLGDQLYSFGYNVKSFLTQMALCSDAGMENAPKVFESVKGVEKILNFASVNDKDKLNSLGLGLSLFMVNSDEFFYRAVNITNSKSIVTLSEHLEAFLEVVLKFDTGKLTTLIETLMDLCVSTRDYAVTLSGVAEGVKTNSGKICTATTDSLNRCITVLNTFAGNGSIIGRNLMSSIASGIYSDAWQIQTAVQNAVNSVNVSIPYINTNVGLSIGGMPHLASGGLAVSPTVALIGEGQDNEAVLPLNDDTFKNIARGIVSQNINNNVKSGDNVNNDYSVTFETGSIQINLTNATDAELEQVAEKIEKIILRRQEIRKMANRG